jgi:hypothetical protein
MHGSNQDLRKRPEPANRRSPSDAEQVVALRRTGVQATEIGDHPKIETSHLLSLRFAQYQKIIPPTGGNFRYL